MKSCNAKRVCRDFILCIWVMPARVTRINRARAERAEGLSRIFLIFHHFNFILLRYLSSVLTKSVSMLLEIVPIFAPKNFVRHSLVAEISMAAQILARIFPLPQVCTNIETISRSMLTKFLAQAL